LAGGDSNSCGRRGAYLDFFEPAVSVVKAASNLAPELANLAVEDAHCGSHGSQVICLQAAKQRGNPRSERRMERGRERSLNQ
jgi:hypothetical protein